MYCISQATHNVFSQSVFPIYQKDRLYYLYKSAVSKTRAESLRTWHQILGHNNVHEISKMKKVVQGMKISDNTNNTEVEISC